jgi:hypothetical protein
MQLILKKHVKCTKKEHSSIRNQLFVMAEWDRLVLCCSNNLPVTVSEKLIDGSFELFFCCIDSPSIEVINLLCCKASVHRHYVLKALQSNNQCVYCRKVLDPQDIINCTPQPTASSVEANVSQTTTLTELKAPPDANTSGEANVSQTATLPELKAPPEANMSQKDLSANMDPPNILSEPSVQDEDMNLHEQLVEGEEKSLSSMSIFGQNNNNRLLFAPTCTTCFNKNKYLSTPEKSVPANGRMSALVALESTSFSLRDVSLWILQ